MDKQFWAGAVAVVTVVVAGAGALPSLLLRPAVEDGPVAGSVEPAPFVSKPGGLAGSEPPRFAVAGVSAPVPAARPDPVVVAKPERKPAIAPTPPVMSSAPPLVIQVAATHAAAPAVTATKPAP